MIFFIIKFYYVFHKIHHLISSNHKVLIFHKIPPVFNPTKSTMKSIRNENNHDDHNHDHAINSMLLIRMTSYYILTKHQYSIKSPYNSRIIT